MFGCHGWTALICARPGQSSCQFFRSILLLVGIAPSATPSCRSVPSVVKAKRGVQVRESGDIHGLCGFVCMSFPDARIEHHIQRLRCNKLKCTKAVKHKAMLLLCQQSFPIQDETTTACECELPSLHLRTQITRAKFSPWITCRVKQTIYLREPTERTEEGAAVEIHATPPLFYMHAICHSEAKVITSSHPW